MSEPGRDPLVDEVRRDKVRRDRARREGEPSLARQFATIGVLGWLVVTPALLGTFVGRWVDGALDSGIFWTLPLMLVGLVVGCWSGWRWMHKA